MSKKIFFLFAVVFLSGSQLYAQSSLVPVYHQVYDWLHYQRVRGNVPYYNYESLPLTRGQITQLISNIDESDLSNGDQRTRHSYLREFSADSLAKYKNDNALVGDNTLIRRSQRLILSDEEPNIYVWHNSESNAVFNAAFSPTSTIVSDDGIDVSSPFYYTILLRSFGTYRNLFGYHIDQFGVSANSDRFTFAYIPFFSRNAKYVKRKNSMEHFEAMASIHKKDWSVAIGRGTLKNGVGKRNNLIYSREGIPFDWIRLNIDSKYFDYTSITGFLTWEPTQNEVPGYPNIFSRTSPSRYTVMHKIQFQPFEWITIGYYEMTNYSNREFEISYFNPVTRLALMQFEQDDQDNGFAGILGSLRPIKGLEVYAELMIDDIGVTRDIIRINNHNRNGESLFAHHFGANYALKSGQVFNVTYQRLDPNIYAHRYPFNAHSESGFGLGSQIGPNGDEWSFNFDQWFSLRSKLSIGYSINRHGLNFFDQDGNFVDVGGDIDDSNFFDPVTGELSEALSTDFLEGDLHEWNTFYGQFVYELWRGVTFKVDASYRKMSRGEQIKDLFVTTIGFKFGE